MGEILKLMFMTCDTGDGAQYFRTNKVGRMQDYLVAEEKQLKI